MTIADVVFYIIVLLFSAIIHEYAHGAMADYLGDSTARYAGRLTLDPRAHIDRFGSIILPLMMLMPTLLFGTPPFVFAYAKPVPYNPYNLRNQRWGPALIGLAGPLTNFLLALAFALLFRLHLFGILDTFFLLIIQVNIILMVFNLVPIPPLDGSKILYAVLPDSAQSIRAFLDRYGFMILLFFVFFLFNLVRPIIDGVFNLLVG